MVLPALRRAHFNEAFPLPGYRDRHEGPLVSSVVYSLMPMPEQDLELVPACLCSRQEDLLKVSSR